MYILWDPTHLQKKYYIIKLYKIVKKMEVD
jgi:hypothetical protein